MIPEECSLPSLTVARGARRSGWCFQFCELELTVSDWLHCCEKSAELKLSLDTNIPAPGNHWLLAGWFVVIAYQEEGEVTSLYHPGLPAKLSAAWRGPHVAQVMNAYNRSHALAATHPLA